MENMDGSNFFWLKYLWLLPGLAETITPCWSALSLRAFKKPQKGEGSENPGLKAQLLELALFRLV